MNEYWYKFCRVAKPNVTMDDAGDMDVPDCATDGSCPEEGGGGGDDEDWNAPQKEPATLLEETEHALQQFSIG